MLIAQGYAENITTEREEVNNAPAPSLENSFHQEEDDEEDDCKWAEISC